MAVSRSFSAEFGDVTVSDEAVHRARRAICTYATDAREAEELLRMVGIHPAQKGF